MPDTVTTPEAKKFLSSAGSFNWNVSDNVFQLDAILANFLGLQEDVAAHGITFQRYLKGIHPDDRDRVRQQCEDSIESGEPCRQEYRLVDKDGAVTPIIAVGQCFRDKSDKPSDYAGILFDAHSLNATRIDEENIIEHCLAAYASAKNLNDDFVTYLLSMVLHELGYQEAAKTISKTRH